MPIESERILAEAEKRGYEYLRDHKTQACSQTVLLVIQELFGPRDDLMIKASGPLAGGSRSYSLCGALLGGVLALGMKYGSEQLDSLDALIKSYEPVKELYRRFEEEFGNRYCIGIIGVDLNNPVDRQRWVETGGPEKCARLTGKTARIVGEIILSGKYKEV
ncbi:MAG: C-GCAxxG-C-C family protein [Candidatus Bathyarchaeia archaeon]